MDMTQRQSSTGHMTVGTRDHGPGSVLADARRRQTEPQTWVREVSSGFAELGWAWEPAGRIARQTAEVQGSRCSEGFRGVRSGN